MALARDLQPGDKDSVARVNEGFEYGDSEHLEYSSSEYLDEASTCKFDDDVRYI